MYQAFFCYALVSEWSKVDGCNPEQREFESHPVLKKNNDAVSYTHLTLPTNREV